MSVKDIKPPEYRYNPITKKIERAVKPKRIKRRDKHRRNLKGCYPGYIFTINGQEYICTDGREFSRPIMPIPVRIFPTPDSPVMLKSIVPEMHY